MKSAELFDMKVHVSTQIIGEIWENLWASMEL
jgi:hypothetical protein